MSEKLYGVDQFYPGDFAPILTGVYTDRSSSSKTLKESGVEYIIPLKNNSILKDYSLRI